jgi:hypothetical protein
MPVWRLSEPTMSGATLDAPAPWPTWKRVGFRALLIYFVLFTFPFPFDQIPWTPGWISDVWSIASTTAADWVAANLLGIEGDLYGGWLSGGGDARINYVLMLLTAVLSLTITLVWSLVDRNARDYRRAARWLELGCCVYLGTFMLRYGMVKLIPVQMPPPSLTGLVAPLGDSTRMGLLWNFMGTSPGYQMVSGAAEVVGGLLLFWRRTRLLGATLVTVVMTNVVLLNFFYAVPIKLLASHLLLIAIGLLLLDAPRLLAVFVHNRAAPAADLRPMFASRRANITAQALKLAYLCMLLGLESWHAVDRYQVNTNARTHEISGVYDVESFVCNGEALPPLLTDARRWKTLIIDHPEELEFSGWSIPGQAAVQGMDGELSLLMVDLDPDSRTITLKTSYVEARGKLSYARVGPDELHLRGVLDGAVVEIRLEQRDLDTITLTAHRFRWAFDG